MATVISIAGVILERTALVAGFLAAAIAVGGFIAHSQAVLGTPSQTDLQRATATGGLCGLFVGILIILFDVITGVG